MCGQVFYVILGDGEFRNPLFKHLSLPQVREIRQDKQFLNFTLNILWKFPKSCLMTAFLHLLVLLIWSGVTRVFCLGSKFIWGQCQMKWPGRVRGLTETIHHKFVSAGGDRGQVITNKSSWTRHLGRDIRCRKNKTPRVWWNFDSALVLLWRSNRVLNHFYQS